MVEGSATNMAGERVALSVDRGLFMMAFGRDVDFHDTHPQSIYLDRQTGNIVWLYGTDDDAYMEAGISADENREGCKAIAAEPDRYLEIPGLDHDDHHRILKRFLRSDWTRDEERRRRAEDAYTGSIGRWKRDVRDEDAVDAFYDFRDAQVVMMAEQFLLEHGIDPIWKSPG